MESYIPSIYPQSYIPSAIPGTSSVVSGATSAASTLSPSVISAIQGAASGAKQPTLGTQGVVNGAVAGAKIDPSAYSGLTPWEQNKLNSIASGRDFFGVDSFLQSISNKSTGAAAGAGTGGNGIGGTTEGWLSPEEMRAKLNGLGSYSGANGMSGGGGSGGGGTGSSGSIQIPSSGQTTSTGNALGSMSPVSGQATPPSYSYNPYNTGQQVSYQSPNGQQQAYGPGSLNMQQANPQSGMQNYLNTTGYQLLGDPSYQRYQQSPGYQYAVDEAMGQVQRNAASRGLLESGRVMRDMTDRAQGMALQDYGNWWNRQNQLYGDYQNRLAGLAGGSVGSEQAYNLGQTMGAGTMQTGNNLASLFGNQGTSGFGGMVNTGAAQANNLMNSGNTQAQINSANSATQLAGATSGLF